MESMNGLFENHEKNNKIYWQAYFAYDILLIPSELGMEEMYEKRRNINESKGRE